MTPDGKELYYTSVLGAGFDFSAILVTRWVDGAWTQPEVASFSGRYKDLEPAVSPDGQRFFFLSDRPLAEATESPGNEDIWVMGRDAGGWSEPQNLGPPVNTERAEFFPSVTRDGTLYFTRRSEDRTESIFRSRWVKRAPTRSRKSWGPRSMPHRPSSMPLSIPMRGFSLSVPGAGKTVSAESTTTSSFDTRTIPGREPVNLGDQDQHRRAGQEWSPYVSPDGRVLLLHVVTRHHPGPFGTSNP